MAHFFTRHEQPPTTGGYVVRRPRATDALGISLRTAFGEEQRLPGEFDRLVHSLNRIA